MSERTTTEEVRQCYDELARRWRTKGIVDRGEPFFGLTGVFPFPSSDHRLVWVDVKLGR